VAEQAYVSELEVETLLEALELIDSSGFFDSNEAWEWIEFEDEIKSEDDYKELIHRAIPNAIEDICRAVNAYASVYHLKDGVDMPEYIVLIEKDGKRYTLMLDLDIECYDEVCAATVLIVNGEKGWIDVPVYYHEVPWLV
jgi:hypothetical protein